MDTSRYQDLNEIYEEYKRDLPSFKKQYLSQLMQKIMAESGATESARQDLVRAVRANDKNRINYYSDILKRQEMEQTHGMGWQKRLRQSIKL